MSISEVYILHNNRHLRTFFYPQKFYTFTPAQEILWCVNMMWKVEDNLGVPQHHRMFYMNKHASHPAFLSLLHHITLKKMHTHLDTLENIPTQRMSWVVSCGVSVLFSLLLYITYFLGFFFAVCLQLNLINLLLIFQNIKWIMYTMTSI